MSSTPQAPSSDAGYARTDAEGTVPADLCEPLLAVDGVGCADSTTARRLIAAGLLAPPSRTAAERARLTAAGHAALAARTG